MVREMQERDMEKNRGANTNALRELASRVFSLEWENAVLENAVQNANSVGDFESSIEIELNALDKEHELEIARQEVWIWLRTEFYK